MAKKNPWFIENGGYIEKKDWRRKVLTSMDKKYPKLECRPLEYGNPTVEAIQCTKK